MVQRLMGAGRLWDHGFFRDPSGREVPSRAMRSQARAVAAVLGLASPLVWLGIACDSSERAKDTSASGSGGSAATVGDAAVASRIGTDAPPHDAVPRDAASGRDDHADEHTSPSGTGGAPAA